jgi:hypothetical protein
MYHKAQEEGMSLPLLIMLAGCQKSQVALDRNALRQDTQERAFLKDSAQTHWEGVRWDIPDRAAAFYEDPLARARYESQQQGYSRVMEVSILHVVLDELPDVPEDGPLRTGTVYVRVEGVGSDNVLRVDEHAQNWYRTAEGWWVQLPSAGN